MDDQTERNLPLELDDYNQLLKEKADALKNLAAALKEFHSQPEEASPYESKNSPENRTDNKQRIGKNLLKSEN